MTRTQHRSLWRIVRLRLGGTLAGALLALVACSPPPPRAAGQVPLLLVANAGERTVSVLDATTDRPTGLPIVLGRPVSRLVSPPIGASGALTHGLRPDDGLEYLSTDGATWRSQTLTLESRALVERAAAISGLAAALYVGRSSDLLHTGLLGLCQLAVFDLARGQTLRTLPVCREGERATGLVLEHSSEGRLAYISLWNEGEISGKRGRIVALDLDTGAPRRSLALAGVPATLALAPAGMDLQPRLYGVQATERGDVSHRPGDNWNTSPSKFEWHLLRIAPEALAIEQEVPLGGQLLEITFAADGQDLYARRPWTGLSTTLVHVDLSTGKERRLAHFPGPGPSIAVHGDSLYLTRSEEGAVWVLNRHTGVRTKTIKVGIGPTSIVLVR